MTLKSYLFAMTLGTILCLVSFGFVLYYINPVESGVVGLILFYSSLFFGLVGFLSLIGFFIRRRLSNNEVLYANIGIAFRQGVLLSLIVTINLGLQQVGELNLVKGSLVAVIIFLVEVFFHYFSK